MYLVHLTFRGSKLGKLSIPYIANSQRELQRFRSLDDCTLYGECCASNGIKCFLCHLKEPWLKILFKSFVEVGKGSVLGSFIDSFHVPDSLQKQALFKESFYKCTFCEATHHNPESIFSCELCSNLFCTECALPGCDSCGQPLLAPCCCAKRVVSPGSKPSLCDLCAQNQQQ